MDPSTRLRIATRIHFALLRQYGEHVEVGSLMRGGPDVREAMWVCEASGDAELSALARQLKHADRTVATAAATPQCPAPQDAAWAGDTSGFGVTRPHELDDHASVPASWFNPSNWLKRSAPSKRH